MELVVVKNKISQVQVRMPELGAAEFFEEVDQLLGEPAVIGERLGLQLQLIEVLIELEGRFDPFEDERIAPGIADFEPHQSRHGPRRRNLRPLQPLQPLKLPHRRTSAKSPPNPVANSPRRIKLQVIRFAPKFKAPHLPVSPVFNKPAMRRQIEEGGFEAGCRHSRDDTRGFAGL
jgi:hypothetical protein